jgi:hypothetical protein
MMGVSLNEEEIGSKIMSKNACRLASKLGVLALVVSLAGLLSSCSAPAQSRQPQPIKSDGSSTVYPITNAIAAAYQANQTKINKNQNVKVEVAFSGTGGGFRKFCAGETDISNASRPILKEEMEVCNKNNVRYIELPIAFDALTIVVNPQNSWAKDITVAELQKIWEPAAEGKITKWNQVRASWPDQPLKLYGAGRDSGAIGKLLHCWDDFTGDCSLYCNGADVGLSLLQQSGTHLSHGGGKLADDAIFIRTTGEVVASSERSNSALADDCAIGADLCGFTPSCWDVQPLLDS